ncbi:MAG: hypothetical protein K0Q74_122 [Gammaproteobacteria bacterium]|nr:hypothetical protein [Gammaproteobacteria bacterium]
MNKNTSRIPLPIWIVGALLLYGLSLYFFVEQTQHQPQCCDAIHYMGMAHAYATNGFFQVTEPSRTFGYPWILSLIIKFSNSLLSESAVIWFFQSTFYFFTVYVIARQIAKSNTKLASYVYLALCTNIFILPYFTVTLTDGLYATLALALLAALIPGYSLATSTQIKLFWQLFLVIFVTSFSIITRPAAIWLLLPVGYFIVSAFIERKKPLLFLGAFLLGVTPLIIQSISNALNYQVISFLPVTSLGKAQIIWGIENIKYGTWTGGTAGNELIQNFYPSSPIIDTSRTSGIIQWYLSHPISILKLIILKFIGAFDWDYLLPYPKFIPNAFFKIAPSIISFSILWWGLVGTAIHTFSHRLPALGMRFIPLISLISWSGVTLLSALELRFTLPLLSYFIVISVVTIYHLVGIENQKPLKYCVIGQILFLIIALLLSNIIRGQATIQW